MSRIESVPYHRIHEQKAPRQREEMRSFKNRLWSLPQPDPEKVRAMIAEGIPPALAPILVSRGLEPAQAEAYCRPRMVGTKTHPGLMPDPYFFKDMEAAVQRLEKAILGGEKIAVWGDYDVDGATSTSLWIRFLAALNTEARIYIPDRIAEGYGPNADGISLLADEGTQVLIIVDSGTVAFEPLAHARELGIDVIVIDHHMAEEQLPEAVAVINPNRLDQEPGYGYLCAAGMSFMTIVGLNRYLRDNQRYKKLLKEPDLIDLLDIVALGTVADVVPLVGLNRAFVRNGLKVMGSLKNEGLKSLCEVAALKAPMQAYHCGFVLGPRINAGGRIGDASTGARLLSTRNMIEAMDMAQRLDALNKERQDMEKETTGLAIEQVEGVLVDEGKLPEALFAIGEDWHEGVIGIVASRLKENYDKPTFVFSSDGKIAKGSARSMFGFDIGSAVIEAKNKGLLVKGGGHAMAAGVTIEVKKLKKFHDFICKKVRESEFGKIGAVSDLDSEISVDQVSLGLIEALADMEPFGQGNPKPRFLLRGARLTKVDILNDRKTGEPMHVRVTLTGSTGREIKGMIFRAAGTPLAEGLLAQSGKTADIACQLDINEWQGRRLPQILIEDARPSTAEAFAKDTAERIGKHPEPALGVSAGRPLEETCNPDQPSQPAPSKKAKPRLTRKPRITDMPELF